MKRTAMPARRAPLRSGAPLHRTGGIAPVSAKRAKANRQRTEALRPLRAAQSGCSRCGVTGVGLDAHELLSRARGGSITDPENIVLLCRPCHELITREPLLAEAEGWALRAGAA